jgi:hypothetical protein
LKAKKEDIEKKRKADLEKKNDNTKAVLTKGGSKKVVNDDLDDPIDASLKERIAAGGIT